MQPIAPKFCVKWRPTPCLQILTFQSLLWFKNEQALSSGSSQKRPLLPLLLLLLLPLLQPAFLFLKPSAACPHLHQLTVGGSCYAYPSQTLASNPCPLPFSCPPFLNLHPSRASQMPHSGLAAVGTAGTKWAQTFLSKCDEGVTDDAATATIYRLQLWT